MLRASAFSIASRGRRVSAGLLAAGLLAAVSLAGCTHVDDVDSAHADELSDTDKFALELEQSIGLVSDPALNSYVQSVGTRLAAKAKRKDIDYRFKILDFPAPNALALPDGRVFVSRGALLLVNSEDELASVLAHEIAHVEQRHARARENFALVTSPIRLGAGIAGWATGLIIPDLGDAIVELGESTTGLLIAPYSREQEREADRVGQSLAAAAGYDPAGLANFLETMVRAETLDPDYTPEESWFDTHPATGERVEVTRAHGASLIRTARPSSVRERASVMRTFDGLVIGANPGKGFFDENWFVHPEFAFVMGFPVGWEGINSGGFVGAKKKDEEVFVMLALVASGSDPLAGAKAASHRLEADLVSNARKGIVNGLRAAKNRVQLTNASGIEQLAELTWIAHDGRIYQVMTVAPVERFESLESIMQQSAHSFRVLTDEEISSILVLKLHVVEGREAESLAELAERVGTPLTPETISLINGKPVDALLEAGEPVKVGIKESYDSDREKPSYRPAFR